jgi:hypothetical protein
MQHFRDWSSAKLQEVVLKFYTDQVSRAKKMMIETFPVLSASDFATDRHSSSARPAKEAEVDDIANMFTVVDRSGKLDDVRFAAIAYD